MPHSLGTPAPWQQHHSDLGVSCVDFPGFILSVPLLPWPGGPVPIWPLVDPWCHLSSLRHSCSINTLAPFPYPLKKKRCQMTGDNLTTTSKGPTQHIPLNWPNASFGFQGRKRTCQVPVVDGKFEFLNRISLGSGKVSPLGKDHRALSGSNIRRSHPDRLCLWDT